MDQQGACVDFFVAGDFISRPTSHARLQENDATLKNRSTALHSDRENYYGLCHTLVCVTQVGFRRHPGTPWGVTTPILGAPVGQHGSGSAYTQNVNGHTCV